MKLNYLFVLLLIAFLGCKKTGTVDLSLEKSKESLMVMDRSKVVEKSAYHFTNEKDRADSLVKYVDLAKSTKESISIDRQIFDFFPDSFEGMIKLFGYDKVSKGAPLYKWPVGENVIKYFGSIHTIPKDEYYAKYIDICINGYWDADNIRNAFGFHKRLSEDTKFVCQVLSKRTDDEIGSVFRFIFDGPHPKNDENALIYDDLFTKLKTEDPHLADMLKTAYDKVLLSDDGHGR